MEGSTFHANLLNLQNYIDDENNEYIIKELETISQIKNVLIHDITPFETLLKNENNDVLISTTKTIAELAKTVTNRNKLSESVLILSVLKLLEIDNLSLQIQTCRALGNLCCESNAVRNILFENEGLEKIVTLIDKNLDCILLSLKTNEDDSNPSDNCVVSNHCRKREATEKNDIEKTYREKLKQIQKVACGLLFNFLVSNEDIQKKALEIDTLKVVEKLLKIQSQQLDTSEDSVTHLLLILTLLLDNGGEIWVTESICQSLIDILGVSVNPDVSELCLEILHGQAENDEIKIYLAKNGLCELMFGLLEKHKELANDDDSRALMKMACDLIVLVLTGDESMEMLYSNGNGVVYDNMVSWLESSDEDLQATGVLAMGNFARKDNHCIDMVQKGISKKLLDILSNHNTTDGDIKIQHAVLSALRNLVIPAQNKSQVLKDGILDIIYPMLSVEHMPVIFKLLGTLRMIIDGQEEIAIELSSRIDFLEKLVYWCYNTDHLGVKGESSRLVAWLIKNCHNSESYTTILNVNDTVKCLIDMVPSQHTVMQIEALLALNLVILTCLQNNVNKNDSNSPEIGKEDKDICEVDENKDFSRVEIVLLNGNLGPNLALLFSKYHKTIEKEVVENVFTLLNQIINSDKLKYHLHESKVSEEMKKLLVNKKLSHLYGNISQMCDRIDTVE